MRLSVKISMRNFDSLMKYAWHGVVVGVFGAMGDVMVVMPCICVVRRGDG